MERIAHVYEGVIALEWWKNTVEITRNSCKFLSKTYWQDREVGEEKKSVKYFKELLK